MNLPLTEDFRDIVLQNRPLIDVRAPIEFNKGAFPNCINLPVLNDEERRLVGTCYKHNGNAEATKLGHKLISGEVKESRVGAWIEFIAQNPSAYLYCFRGGQRSGISQTWLDDAGITIPRLKGGFKKFRNFLMSESERISATANPLILGGRTGVGKTILIHKLKNTIDLEGIANHRGSSFGRQLTPQPSQIDFESILAYQLIHFEAQKHSHLVLEHESVNIGGVHIPKPVYVNFEAGQRINLVASLEERTEITYQEYVVQAQKKYQDAFGEEGLQRWIEDISSSMQRIKRRIGDQRFNHTKQLLEDANNGDIELHKEWVSFLLKDYYDPMYDYQIEKSKIPLVFSGNKTEVLEFIKDQES